MKALIFDVDGTIWDSTDPVALSWNAAICKVSGKDPGIDRAFLSNTFGRTMDEIAKMLFPDVDEKTRAKWTDYCFRYENEYLEEHPGELYEGMRESLTALSQKYDLYIVSNCQKGYIEVMLKTTGLAPLFKGFLCYGDTLDKKSVTIRRLMEEHHIADAVYIGDTLGDATAASEAGIDFIFASYGFGNVPDAKYTIASISGLLPVLEENF